jgi:hypothetical protein
VELEIKKEEVRLAKEEKQILKIKLKLQQSKSSDNITIKKLNKLLDKRNDRIKQITNNQQINNNNQQIHNNQQIINNFNLIGFGKEEIHETLTNQEKRLIINSKYSCLEKLIEIVHCGKYNQFKNIVLTNMKDNYMYKYDEKLGHFILCAKSEILNSLIDYRLG